MPLKLRLAQDTVDAVMVFRAYKQMHGEGLVPGSFDDTKTLANVLRMVKQPGAAVLMVMDGEKLAGVLSLIEEFYWYSTQDYCLSDKGLYVHPDYRSGDALKLLLEAAKNASDDTGLPVFITIFNAKRKRGGGSGWERLGATLGYVSRGAMMAHSPHPPQLIETGASLCR